MRKDYNALKNEVLVEFLQEDDARERVRPIVVKKIQEIKGKNIPFRNKFMSKEERRLAAKKSVICEGLFAVEMFDIEKTCHEVENDTVMEFITSGCKYPMKKVSTIRDLLTALEWDFTTYERIDRDMKELAFLHLYATFLCLMRELKGTSKESKISSYQWLFENTFAFK